MTGPAAPPMRILEIELVGHGGLAHYAFNLSRALAESGHRVTLITARRYELADRERPAGLEIVPDLARGEARFGRLPRPLLSLWRKLEAFWDALTVLRRVRRLQPVVVHLHATNPIALLHALLLRRRRHLLVFTAHVVTPHESMPLARRIYGWTYRLADRVIAHSRFDRDRLVKELGVQAKRVAVVPHGEYGFFAADAPEDRDGARRRLGLEPEDEVALFFGYIREYKGLDVLLDAWPQLAAERPAARLVIAGDPARLDDQRRRELERRAEEVGVKGHFGYVPFSEVGHYFAAADVLVLPYRRISQSGVLYLALALGLAVVATRVGGLPEMLRDGESALLVSPESPGELSSALARVLGDDELRQRLAAGGLEIARRHSWPAIAERSEELFRRPAQRARS